jgi:hypothetical protein
MEPMASTPGPKRRPRTGESTLLPKTRVHPDAEAKLRAASQKRNASLALLTDELLRRAIWDEAGQLVGLLPADTYVQQEMPLKSA